MGVVVDCATGEIVVVPDPPPGPAPVPATVTPLQMRRALRAAGLKAQADAYLATLPDDVAEAWEYAVVVRRDNAFVASAATALGMTTGQADDLFRLAATFTE